MLGGVALVLALGLRSGSGQKPVAASSQAPALKEFSLVARPITWELATGKKVSAWGYEGRVPGPEIRVREGGRLRVVFTNELTVATTIHWHGVAAPANMDGVPGLNQQPVQPGETFTYEFIAKPAGTKFYHTHGSGQNDEAMQLDMGLYGPLIIEPASEKPQYDREYTLMLDEWAVSGAQSTEPEHQMQQPAEPMTPGEIMEAYNTCTINGKAFPATETLVVKKGERVRLRFVNAGTMAIHSMHLHGHAFRVVATDGYAVPEAAQITKDTITLAPGERVDVEFIADNPGTWLVPCHELHHADGGMATIIKYEGI